jgi:hypothetical protein
VAIPDWQGGQIALAAKAAVPSACLWARPAASSRIYCQLVLEQAIRCADPLVCLSGKWLVRQLAPDSSPIEIETMSGQKDQDKLLHAMATETANVHVGTNHVGTNRAAARIAADLTAAPANGCGRRSRTWRRPPSATGKSGKSRNPPLHPGGKTCGRALRSVSKGEIMAIKRPGDAMAAFVRKGHIAYWL